jgi:hypothetical protein
VTGLEAAAGQGTRRYCERTIGPPARSRMIQARLPGCLFIIWPWPLTGGPPAGGKDRFAHGTREPVPPTEEPQEGRLRNRPQSRRAGTG